MFGRWGKFMLAEFFLCFFLFSSNLLFFLNLGGIFGYFVVSVFLMVSLSDAPSSTLG